MRSWQSYFLNGLLRALVRRRFSPQGDLRVLRRRIGALERALVRVAPDVRRSEVDAGGIPGQWVVVPQSRQDAAVVLYLHGGGFFAHLPRFYTGFLAHLCRRTGARGLIPDYRLAPEHPFPAAPDDCLACYRWLLRTGHPPERLVLAGDSAGAALVLATLIGARDAGLPMPACAILLSPPSDATVAGFAVLENERKDPFFRLQSLLLMRHHYLGAANPTNPLISPVFADLVGLPPLLFQVGSTELLRDDVVRVADRARAAGVVVECQVWAGMPHAFPLFGFLPEGRRARDRIVEFVGERMPGTLPTGEGARAPVGIRA